MNFELMIRHITQMKHGEQLRVQMMRIAHIGNPKTALRLVVSLLLMIVVGVGDAWGDSPVDITRDENNNGAIEDSEKKLYLIQIERNQAFYMMPHSNNSNVNVANVPSEKMLWYFLDAGKNGDDQYYYIVNNSTGRYLNNSDYSSKGRTIQLATSNNFDSSDKFKFIIVDKGNGYYNINMAVSNGSSYNGLNKQSGLPPTTLYVRLTTSQYINDANSKWKFIPYNGSFDWVTPRNIVLSTEGNTHYFKIRNVKDNSYYISTSSSNVTISNVESRKGVWYFKQAPSDPSTPMLSYYYIVNAQTGNYMYYSGTETNGNDQSSVVKIQEKGSENEDRYQFVVVQAGQSDTDNTICYNIVPKLLRDKPYNSNSIGTASIGNDNTLGVISGRWIGSGNNATVANESHWTFEEAEFSAKCTKPSFSYDNKTNKLTLIKTEAEGTIHYSTNGGSSYSEYSAPFDIGTDTEIWAYTSTDDIPNSDIAKCFFITSWPDGGGMSDTYYLKPGFSASSSLGTTEDNPFTGTIDGLLNAVSASKPLVLYANGATIRNVILDGVTISSGTTDGDVGAICCVANGATRIYNCGVQGTSSSISGSGNVGSIAGVLNDKSRVVNCYSFATVSGGSLRGGIVGNNTYASKSGDIKTMVMNCMFYGTIEGGGAPVYNGTIISNAGTDGLNNFNYYSSDDFQGTPSPYHCALAAENIYLERFEFHRNILNSNRELAAWYATGSAGNSGEMAKWVLDKSIAKYPILKEQGYYPSVINYEDAPVLNDNFSVSISQGSNGPTGASINSSKTLKVYDKDIANHHYNYRTIRLPYYCEVGGTLNYTDNKVMTGWDVTVTGGSANFTDASDSKNYANRDNYSGRVFSQGAYLDIPDGATVSITSHWADCVYLSDPTYDVTYSTSYSPTYVNDMGTRYGGEKKFNGQVVYTTLSAALTALSPSSSGSVYDYAIVLVGNYHQYRKTTAMWNGITPFTLMSADLNNDCEPDYTFFYQHTQRVTISPVRFDFLNFPGIGLGQKVDGTGNMAAQGIFQPKGWFEVTNTCLVHFTQFEYDMSSKEADSPVILLGGIYDQFVSSNANNNVGGTSYIHLGSNAYFPNEFCNGTHGDRANKTPHIPISVTGGEYKNFYLSGMFNPDVVPNADNATCYIDGGYFSEEVAGAGQEKINGNVTWYITNADITNFYGGGINDAKSITGDITVNIKNSRVDQYCGGPKFGNMSVGKKITTTATDKCVFGKFFGAGYGGTSLYQRRTQNEYESDDYDWDTWADEYDTAFDGGYSATYHGVPTSYKYEYLDRSGAEDDIKVGRFYINYASLSLAVTHDVESTLTDCTIKSDFFGGGNLGMVNGDIESTLTDCTVYGSVFGGGFSATPPTVDVWPKNGFGAPNYNPDAGVYIPGNYPDTKEEGMIVYTWTHDTGSPSSPLTKDGDNYWIYTAKDTENNKDLSKLGQVTGDVTLTIDGESKVGKILHGIWNKTQNKLVVDTSNENSSEGGGVFGGGDASAVLGSTIVILKDKAEIEGNVFGGGNKANVNGSATVNIEQ